MSAFKHRVNGFSYMEVLVSMIILSISLVPAMQTLQSGLQGLNIHQQVVQQHYALITRMENVMADSYSNLLAAAEISGSASIETGYSDPPGQQDRIVVFLSLYDADADPFSITDMNNDGDNDIYTGDSSHLLWIKVEVENSAYRFESLRQRLDRL